MNLPTLSPWRSALLLAAALIVSLSFAGDARANLLTNPSFEEPDLNNGFVIGAQGWTPFSTGGGGVTRDLLPQEGENSLFTVESGTSFDGAFQTFPASEGERWIGTGWALNHASNPITGTRAGAITIQWFDAMNQVISFEVTQLVNASTPAGTTVDDYVFGTVEGIAPAGTTSMRFNYLNGFFMVGGDGLIIFDNLSLTRIPEPCTAWLCASGLGLVVGGRRVRR